MVAQPSGCAQKDVFALFFPGVMSVLPKLTPSECSLRLLSTSSLPASDVAKRGDGQRSGRLGPAQARRRMKFQSSEPPSENW